MAKFALKNLQMKAPKGFGADFLKKSHVKAWILLKLLDVSLEVCYK